MAFTFFATSYLPFEMFVSGFWIGLTLDTSTYTAKLLADGTGRHNSGAFCTMSIVGRVYGYNDTFYSMLAGGFFGGLAGPNITDLSSWYMSSNGQDRQFYAQSTGVTSKSTVGTPDYDLDNVGKQRFFRYTSIFYTRDELVGPSGWRSCSGGDEYIDLGCNVFMSTQAIIGLSTGQLKPFTHDDPVGMVDFFSSDLLRGLNMTFTSDSTVHSLETFKYNVPSDYWMNSNSNVNNAKYRIDTSGYMQLTSYLGLPVGGGNPNLGVTESAAGIVLDGSYDSYTADEVSWEIHYEPIVGIPAKINGHQVATARYTSSFLNSGLYDGLFTSNAVDIMYFPFFWGNLQYEMEQSSADLLAGVLYGLPAMGSTLMLVFVILGVVFLIAGVALCMKGKSGAVSPSK